jgi:hypothetical protein
MSKLSDNIQITYKNVITIYQETANLLQDASSILEKSGYRCLHGNSIGTELSRDINNPQWWIIPYASRYFVTQENPDEIKVIGVFFVDRDYVPIEPIILIGCLKMQKEENEEALPYNYWYLRDLWFTMIKERKLKVDLDFEGKWNVISGKIRAVPLIEVNNQETLKESVIDPFIAMSS